MVPGEYLFFVIEDPRKNLDITLRVTGLSTQPNRWAVYGGKETIFYLETCERKIPAYVNRIDDLGEIHRTFYPEFRSYEEYILRKYFVNPGLPQNQVNQKLEQPGEFVDVEVISRFDFLNNYVNNDRSTIRRPVCGQSYTSGDIILSEEKDWIKLVDGNAYQLAIQPGLKIRIENIVVTGKSQPGFIFPQKENVVSSLLCTDQLSLLVWNVGSKQPVTFNTVESRPLK